MQRKSAGMFNWVALGLSTALLAGCYEDLQPQQPQAQTPPPKTEEGPITSMTSHGGGEALGGAKRTATNIVNKAEEHSRKTAGEADPAPGESDPSSDDK